MTIVQWDSVVEGVASKIGPPSYAAIVETLVVVACYFGPCVETALPGQKRDHHLYLCFVPDLRVRADEVSSSDGRGSPDFDLVMYGHVYCSLLHCGFAQGALWVDFLVFGPGRADPRALDVAFGCCYSLLHACRVALVRE